MASIIYGMQPYGFQNLEQNMESYAVGKNSEVFAVFDPVTYTNGTIAVAGTTNSIMGVAMKAQTMSSTNNGAANVTPLTVPVDETTVFLMGGGNSATTGFNLIADVGTYWKLTGTTGSVQVDIGAGVQTTTNRNVMIVKVDPLNEGTTGSTSAGDHKVLVKVVRRPTWIDQ